MEATLTLFKREFSGYFRSPIAYVFLAAFVVVQTGLTWFVAPFFESDEASLDLFFMFLPWVFAVLIPAIGMRLWAEEKRSGTWELLLTLPISVHAAIFGKFFAAWAFIVLAVFLTFPMPLTVEYLGDPDWGVMLSGYFGAIVMAGAYLSLCSLASALTRNQVVAFVLSVMVCLVLVLLGFSAFNDLLAGMGWPVWLVDGLANFSFTTHFELMQRGLITLEDVLFFTGLGLICLLLNALVLKR